MNVPSFVKKFADDTYKLAQKPGKMLLLVGVAGWVLSSLAQVTAVVINNKIPKDQKKFLIPQELADAGVNIASFFLITQWFTKHGENMVKSGKLITPAIKKGLEKFEVESKIGTKGFDITDLDQIKETSSKFNKEFQTDYYKFADGVSFISSTLGSIISCNIITPILRNKIAANRQKASIEQDKIKNDLTLPTSPILPAQNRFGIDDYRAKTMNANITPGGSMRI